jgi:hypothetical protein
MRQNLMSIHVSIRNTSVLLLKVDLAIKRKLWFNFTINQKYFYFLRDAMVFTLRKKIHNTCSSSMFCSYQSFLFCTKYGCVNWCPEDIVERRGMFRTWQSRWPWLETTFSFLRSLLSLLSSLSVFLAIFSLSFLRSLISLLSSLSE